MKKVASQFTILVLALVLFSINISEAKVWRINNTPGVTADFTDPEIALNSTVAGKIVATDDTLYLEGSATSYGNMILDKKIVMIGTGYFLGTALPDNIGLQASPFESTIGVIEFRLAGSGSTFIGLAITTFGVSSNAVDSDTDNITLTRCKIGNIGVYYNLTLGKVLSNWKINKCHIGSINISTIKMENWEITNSIFTSGITASFAGNSVLLIRNNIFRSTVDINNAYFANNLLGNVTLTAVNCTVKNNFGVGATTLPTGNNNVNNTPDASLFVGLAGNSTDGQWKLKAGSPAIGAGETVGGITPDCGPFGTADPYLLSGIPPIPTIYALTVPANTATNLLPITISTKSNN